MSDNRSSDVAGALRVTHAPGDRIVVSAGDVEIATYVYVPQTPEVEARKPYMHPIRTLDGAVISAFRPWDHPWHKGFQMTWSHVADQNFWGGKTFSVEDGYEWRDNVGRMEHLGFDRVDATAGQVAIDERLGWITAAGERWIDEKRSLVIHDIDPDTGTWVLDFATELRNVRGQSIALGSPTTHGRENAGYTGFFWRGPRSWTGGEIIAQHGRGGEEMMGQEADWLAVSGNHDDLDGGATVLVFAGSSSSALPIKWFVRNEPFAAINPSPAFDDEIDLKADDSLRLEHRAVFIDHVSTREELEALAQEHGL